MVIDFDTSSLPRGSVGWARLLTAIMAAHRHDENQWIEFKANVDPSTPEGRATVAKAIVAFANRDPLTAQQWMGGHEVIVVGLEPGNLVGTSEVDPAVLHSKVNALLAPPAPGWDPLPVQYEGKHVLIITVDPPRQGDPIAVIGKSMGAAEDGHVFVRQVGKSERAKAADIRRLSARLLPADRLISGIAISPVEDAQVPVVKYPKSWLEEWLYAEERRLLAPLDPPPPTRPMTSAERRQFGLTDSRIASISKASREAQKAMAAFGGVTRQETRSTDEFRAEVATYLDSCREALEEAFEDLRHTAALGMMLEITNTTAINYENVLVELQVEGDVFGYEDEGHFTEVADYLPRAPRSWGPWVEDRFRLMEPGYSGLMGELAGGVHPIRPSRPSLTITNGDPVSVERPPFHLYPQRTEHLLGIWLVGDGSFGDDVRVTWTATASNVDGKLEGEFTIPVAPGFMDLSDALDRFRDR